jgi:hypothetical protein
VSFAQWLALTPHDIIADALKLTIEVVGGLEKKEK